MVADAWLTEDDVRLAEQVVQLDVEAGDPDARADAERVREHARASGVVDGDHVRRVLAALANGLEGVDQREHSLRLVEAGEARGAVGSSSGTPESPARVTTRLPAYSTMTGSRQSGR